MKEKNVYRNSGYKAFFKRIPDGRGGQILRETCKEYARMLQLHTDFNPMTAMHWKQCCERAALYKTVGKYYSDQAMEWIDEMTEEYARKGGEFLNLLLKVPGMTRLFLPGMKKAAGKAFGAEAGFKNRFGVFTSTEAHFDILDCPYCRYLEELGCPELKAGFCRSDEFLYGNLDKFSFERTQTLAGGGSCCDFCMKKRK